jgi:hypothetical protein
MAMKISITLWAGNLIPTHGEHDLDRLADDFSRKVQEAVAESFPAARVTVLVEDGEEMETAIRISPPDGPEAEEAEGVVREIVDAEWEAFDFDAYAPAE